jgi:soluble lytic murein transglycosylase-like protein
MAKFVNRPDLKLLVLALALGFCAHVPHAQADVFEIGDDGKWRQIDKIPSEATGIETSFGENDPAQIKLPPIRLAAITTVNEPAGTAQPIILSSRAAQGQYAPLVNAAAQQYGISPALVDAVMWQESRYNPRAVSNAGAIGLMQLMPATARSLGVNPHDPWQNVFGGAAYLRKQLDRFNNNIPFALAAYNAGPEAVAKHGGIPPYAETRNYVKVIMQRLMSQNQQ